MELAKAREYVEKRLDDGVHCPCCGKYTRRYKRKFNATMARSLFWLVSAYRSESTWIDVPKNAPRWLVRSNQLPTIRWWNLAQRPKDTNDPDLKHSGLWKPTKQGIDFVDLRLKVFNTAVTYDGNVEKLTGTLVSIEDTLGTKFSYAEMMAMDNYN